MCFDRRALALVGVLLGAVGCSDVCTRNSDCADGLICGAENLCVAPPRDASVDGGESRDGGSSDGSADLASVDLTTSD